MGTTEWPVVNKIKRLIQNTSRGLTWKFAMSEELFKLAKKESDYLEREENEKFDRMYENWDNERGHYIKRLNYLKGIYEKQLLSFGIQITKQGTSTSTSEHLSDAKTENFTSSSSDTIYDENLFDEKGDKDQQNLEGKSKFIVNELIQKYEKITNLLNFFSKPDIELIDDNESNEVTDGNENDSFPQEED